MSQDYLAKEFVRCYTNLLRPEYSEIPDRSTNKEATGTVADW
jgi:hypothetical protein